jgi:hypothetical protein
VSTRASPAEDPQARLFVLGESLRSGQIPMTLANSFLDGRHYLGGAGRGIAWSNTKSIIVLANPSSRRLPCDRWLELTRWLVLEGIGSQHWAECREFIAGITPPITTVVSYSDPSVGHDGAIYRASGWLWAPTWHRLRPPPTGNGKWSDKNESTKDRWVYPLLPDAERQSLLAVDDESVLRRFPYASYTEPRWKRGHTVHGTGGGDYRRWSMALLKKVEGKS